MGIIVLITDSEYESMAASKDDPQTESSPIEEPPPPVRYRSLGGRDYYSLSYNDPIYKNRNFSKFYTLQYRKLVFLIMLSLGIQYR
jgi:hypothetical protein